jgi:hypothetical protein
MRRLTPVMAVVVSLLAAGCGGASTSSSSSQAGSGSGSGSGPGTAAGTVTAAGTGGSQTSSATATSSSTTSTATADTGVRLPATFTIRAGDILLPGVVAAPKHTAVALTVRSGDDRAHVFVLLTPHRRMARVLPGKPLRLLLKGLPNGAYAVKIDGRVRGRLIIGATPGP